MKGSEYFQQIVNQGAAAREDAIWNAVLAEQIVLDWQPIEFDTDSGQRVMLLVSRDTLRVGDETDSVRVMVSHKQAQQIADHLDAVLPSARLSDAIWAAADLKIKPPTQPWYSGEGGDGTMGLTKRMLDFHRIVEDRIDGRSYQLLAGHSKDWINSPLLGTPDAPAHSKWNPNEIAGCNYGWHGAGSYPSASMPGVSIIQPAAIAHDWFHFDYSQQLRLIARAAFVCSHPGGVAGLGAAQNGGEDWLPTEGEACQLADGSTGVMRLIDVYDLMYDNDLHPVVAHERTNYELRHPALPWPSQDAELMFEPPKQYTGGTGSGGTNGNGQISGGDEEQPLLVKMAALGLGAFGGIVGVKLARALATKLPSHSKGFA